MRSIRHSQRRRAEAGVTLIEIMIVVAIFGIMAVMSATAVGSWLPIWRTRQAAFSFAADLNSMRMASIKDNSQYKLEVTAWDTHLGDANAGNAGAWTLSKGDSAYGSTTWDILPANVGTTIDDHAGIIEITDGGNSAMHWVSIDQPTITSVVFSPRGWVDNSPTDFTTTGYIEFVFVNKRDRVDGGDDQWRVMVSRGGIVRVEPGKHQWVPDGSLGTEVAGSASTSPTGYSP